MIISWHGANRKQVSYRKLFVSLTVHITLSFTCVPSVLHFKNVSGTLFNLLLAFVQIVLHLFILVYCYLYYDEQLFDFTFKRKCWSMVLIQGEMRRGTGQRVTLASWFLCSLTAITQTNVFQRNFKMEKQNRQSSERDIRACNQRFETVWETCELGYAIPLLYLLHGTGVSSILLNSEQVLSMFLNVYIANPLLCGSIMSRLMYLDIVNQKALMTLKCWELLRSIRVFSRC